MASSYNIDLEVMPYKYEVEDKAGANEMTMFRFWCLDRKTDKKNSTPKLLRIENFPIFFFVELPATTPSGRYWDKYSAHAVIDAICKNVKEEHRPLAFNPSHFRKWKKLYYAGDIQYPMIMMRFKNIESSRIVASLLEKVLDVEHVGRIKCTTHENWIDPLRKIMTRCNIDYSSWFRCKGKKVPKNERLDPKREEYYISWPTIKEVPEEECMSWKTNPGIISADIEAYSHRKRAFPDKWDPRHVAYMVSMIYQKIGDKKGIMKVIPDELKRFFKSDEDNLEWDGRQRYCIIIGDCKNIPEEKMKNATIFRVDNEEELIRMFAAVIQHHDPEIITGYNLLGFDYPYLDKRRELMNINWPIIGRLRGIISYIHEQNWKSGAYGHNKNNILVMPGRITIDLLVYIKREYKLSFYDLNTVSKHFINKTKHDVKAADMFTIYKEMKAAVPGTEEYDKALDRMMEVVYYCIQDSELVLDIIDKIGLWVGAVELSRVVGVSIEDTFVRGQQIRCVSQIYNMAVRENRIVDTHPCPKIPFEGGFVNRPTPGKHDNVIWIDFKSLYPSIIDGYNICYTTFVHPSMMMIKGKVNTELRAKCNVITLDCSEEYDPEEDVEDMDEEDKNARYRATGTKGTYEFWFLKAPVDENGKDIQEKKGILPRLVRYLVTKRRETQAKMKVETDSMVKETLGKRQLALKVSANSIYGFLGVREGGKLPLLQGAMAVTAWGRQMIKEVNSYIVETYNGVIIYGDTDSSAVVLPEQVKTSADCFYWGKRLEKETSDLFPDPIEMEFEKATKLLSIKKKKYAGWYIDDDGSYMYDKNGDPSLIIRGIMIARRDNCEWARAVYKKCLDMIMRDVDIRVTIRYLIGELRGLLEGKIPIERLVITKTLGANYKNETYSMKIFGDELRRIGRPAQPGDRLGYIMVKRPPGPDGKPLLQGYRMCLPEVYEESQENNEIEKREVIDYEYYFTNLLMNHIDQLIAVGYNDIIPFMRLRYRPTTQHGYSTMENFTSMWLMMTKKGVTDEELMAKLDDEVEYALKELAKKKELGEMYDVEVNEEQKNPPVTRKLNSDLIKAIGKQLVKSKKKWPESVERLQYKKKTVGMVEGGSIRNTFHSYMIKSFDVGLGKWLEEYEVDKKRKKKIKKILHELSRDLFFKLEEDFGTYGWNKNDRISMGVLMTGLLNSLEDWRQQRGVKVNNDGEVVYWRKKN